MIKKEESAIKIEDKRIGGFGRARIAREELSFIFKDPKHPLYFSKDIEYARKFDVTRHTIYHIRDQLSIPPRSERILNRLKGMETKDKSLRELSELLNIKYQNLYKIITDNKIPIKDMYLYRKDHKILE